MKCPGAAPASDAGGIAPPSENVEGMATIHAAATFPSYGIVGVLAGVAITLLITALSELSPAIMWSAVGGSVLLSAGIGLVFGLQPAWRASNIDPIEALRS